MNRFGNLQGCAVDLGGTKIAAARFVDGEIVRRCQTRTEGEAPPEVLIDTIAGLLSELDFTRDESFGLAAAGKVDAAGNWGAVNQRTLSKVKGVPMRQLVEERIGSCLVVNDAAAATLAEARFGLGHDIANFAFITVSTGVGGGLILNHQLHQSEDGMAGHLGFMSSRYATELCGSGRHATVESIASGRAIEAAAKAAGHDEHDARAVARAAKQGETWADSLFETSAAAISDLCGDLRCLLGIKTIALGGGIGLSQGYLGRVNRHLTALPLPFQPHVDTAKTGIDGPLVGALCFTQMAHAALGASNGG